MGKEKKFYVRGVLQKEQQEIFEGNVSEMFCEVLADTATKLLENGETYVFTGDIEEQCGLEIHLHRLYIICHSPKSFCRSDI
ncbi:MAG: hypothetical protein ACLTRS_05655 [Lachnospiraceae bacterium]